MIDIYLLPNTYICKEDVVSSNDWELINSVLDLGLLIVILCTKGNDYPLSIKMQSAFAPYILLPYKDDIYDEYRIWTEVISSCSFELYSYNYYDSYLKRLEGVRDE